VVETVLDAEQPDLVVLSGDMVSGFAFPAANLLGYISRWRAGTTWYEQLWRRLIEPLHARKVPYASILGNHDAEADLKRRDIVKMDAATGTGLSLTQPGPANITGAGNYYIDVYDSTGTQVAARIWMLDSGNRGCERLAWGWCVDRLAAVALQVPPQRMVKVVTVCLMFAPCLVAGAA
jgi:pre-mRNA-splicing factor SYF1